MSAPAHRGLRALLTKYPTAQFIPHHGAPTAICVRHSVDGSLGTNAQDGPKPQKMSVKSRMHELRLAHHRFSISALSPNTGETLANLRAACSRASNGSPKLPSGHGRQIAAPTGSYRPFAAPATASIFSPRHLAGGQTCGAGQIGSNGRPQHLAAFPPRLAVRLRNSHSEIAGGTIRVGVDDRLGPEPLPEIRTG
jgi:hypothetical protein